MLTRRHILLGAAALTMPIAPRRLWAGTSLDMGGLRIDTLSDGNLVLPGNFAFGDMSAEEIAALVARHGLSADQLTPPCNLTLLRDGTHTVLFDVGAGPDFMPSAGKLADALDALGLSPDEITHVVFTHAHPDHLWGLLDEFDDPIFPDAAYLIGADELAYWTDPATVDTIREDRKTFAVGAARRLEVIADRITTLADGDEVLPGVIARLTPGHTPGHMSFDISGPDGTVVVIGDAIGNHHIAFDQPDRPSGSDQDPAVGAATRVALMDRLAERGDLIVGFHLPGGGLGRVERDGAAYRFVEV